MNAAANRPGRQADGRPAPATAPPDPAIEVRDLTRRFGDFVAVDHLSFSVPRGRIFGMLGPNGAGKTTAIKMLAGLLLPSEGTAEVAGYDIIRQADDVKRNLGYMSQLFSLYPDLTVSENIELFAGLYDVRGERLARRRAWVLRLAGLEHQRDRLTADLPLGWKQRLALGCAVLHEPPILFLDEPTSGVDPVSRRTFWDLIYNLADGGTTVLVSTHYMEEAEYCHRVALLNRGRLAALGTPDELRHSIGHPILELETDDVLRSVSLLEHAPGVLEAVMFGRQVHVTVEDAERARSELPALLAREGIGVSAVGAVEPSLEDAVVALIRRAGGPAGEDGA